MSSQLWRSVAKLTPNTLLLPKNVGANKVLAQTLALASSTRKAPASALLVRGIKQIQDGQFRLQYALISTSKKKEDGTSITADVTTTDHVDPTTTTSSKVIYRICRSHNCSSPTFNPINYPFFPNIWGKLLILCWCLLAENKIGRAHV